MEWISLVKEYDEQSKYAIELALNYMVKYYKYEDVEARKLLTTFIKEEKTRLDNGYILLNDGAFYLASLIHYMKTINSGDIEGFLEWKTENEIYQKYNIEAGRDFFGKVLDPTNYEGRYD